MTDEQLKSSVRESLNDIINKKQLDENSIAWNKEFVEKVVKTNFNNLDSIINKQEKENSSVKTGEDSSIVSASAYVPGRRIITFSKYAYHWSGYILWGFFCRMDWSWNATEITSVYPNTYAEIYDPSWGYAGIIANHQRFTNGQIEFNKYVKGDFYWPMQQMVSTHR